ncbi:hypothetical protein Asi03nite_08320 [Actinoplanes siamensis]|uniref:Uncharacterized protein n=1 Tax=Actinoplanes siamensis TaxID=1223317 RepID=A0A919KCY7_9ACTN|nr:hypothetical protein Asi03nite_08320 [Actinoplanes siamensis]
MNAPKAAYIDHSGRSATSTTSNGTATLTPARNAAGIGCDTFLKIFIAEHDMPGPDRLDHLSRRL